MRLPQARRPAGLSLDPNTGVVSGTPTAPGPYTYTITATDSTNGATTSYTVTGTIGAGAPLLESAMPATASFVGMPYAQQNLGMGGVGPYTYSVSSGALPAGTTLNPSTGIVSGTASVAGPYSYVITVTDSLHATATAPTSGLIMSMFPPVLPLLETGTPSPTTQVGQPYGQSNVGTGGTAPYVYSVTAGALPAGVTLDPISGVVSGTPTVAGPFSYTVTVTDINHGTATYVTTGNIAAVALTEEGTPSPNTQVGQPYSQPNLGVGGTGPYVYSVTAGSLPAGVTLDPGSGLVAGTPTAAGPFSYTITVTDANGLTATHQMTGTIAPVALTETGTPSATTQVGQSYSQPNVGAGGTAPYTYAVTAGALPAGVTLDPASGVVSGTPTAAGSFSYTVTVTDANGLTATHQTTGTIAAANALTEVGTNSFATLVGQPYNQSNVGVGGTGPYTYSVTAGALPAGVTLDPATGVVSGMPTASGPFSYSVTVTDANGMTAVHHISGTIGGVIALTETGTPSATTQVGQPYTQPNVGAGGTGPYTYSVTAGALPAGVILNAATGTVSGTPTTFGPFSYTITVTDANGLTATHQTAGSMAAAPLVEEGTPSPVSQVGQPYSQPNVAAGGVGPYTYTVTAGALPAGVTLNPATGVVSGTPTAFGPFSYTITVTDSRGTTATHETTGLIAAAPLTETATPSQVTQVGSPYYQTNVGGGGVAPYTFSVAAGTLPAGLTLNPTTGVVSGVPTAVGPFSYTIKVTDAQGVTATRQIVGRLLPGEVLALGPTSLDAPTQGVPYSSHVAATGGSGEGYRYSITAGALPSGLSLNPSTGAITGKTLAHGTFSFTVKALDSQGNWGIRVYTIAIAERADPSQDSEVRALIAAQFQSAKRMAEGQTVNAMRHMEDLHNGLRCGVSNGIKLSGQQMAMGTSTVGGVSNAADQSGQPAAAQAARKTGPMPFACDDHQPRVALWAAGSISQLREDRSKFNANALTIGVDARLLDRLIVGAAAGFGFSDNTIGTKGTRSNDDARTAMAYASLKAVKGVFIDGVFGQTWIDFNGRRFLTADQALASFGRKGDVTFGSASLTLEQSVGSMLVDASVRYDYFDAKLDGYAERSADAYALTFDAAKQKSRNLVAGLRMETTYTYAWGKMTPTVRVEMRHAISGAYSQLMAYSDMPSRHYRLSIDGTTNDLVSASVGARFSFSSMELGAELGTSSTALDSFSGAEMRLRLRKKF